jgi:hypothetical protein
MDTYSKGTIIKVDDSTDAQVLLEKLLAIHYADYLQLLVVLYTRDVIVVSVLFLQFLYHFHDDPEGTKCPLHFLSRRNPLEDKFTFLDQSDR